MDSETKKIFEAVVNYFNKQRNLIPLSFLLGFYVSTAMTRWWNQYLSIPWPTGIAVYVASTLHGQDESARAMRRTIMRYVCLSLTMVFRVLSPRVKKRFLKLSELVDAGLLNDNELSIIEDLDRKFPGYSKNWLPIVWASSIVTQAREEGKIKHDFAVKTVLDSLNVFREKCAILMHYNSVNIPLVYTQVVTIAVYSYFLTVLIGQQWIEQNVESKAGPLNLDMIPIFITLQFLFYMGWLKVAETLMNPFGEDDDDFEVNYMIDRNLQMSYLIVDEMRNDHPEVKKDQYWDGIPIQLNDVNDDDPNDKIEDTYNEPDDTADYLIEKGSLLKRPSIRIAPKISAVSNDGFEPELNGIQEEHEQEHDHENTNNINLNDRKSIEAIENGIAINVDKNDIEQEKLV